jgi:hypothetical protein
MGLQRRLPSHHLSKDMQDLVKLSAGTIATLTALVLGLLVSSAKSSFDGIQTGIVQGSAKFILLDRALARYGPESGAAREQLKRVVAAGIEMVWPTEKTGVSALTSLERANGIELVQDKLRELTSQKTTPSAKRSPRRSRSRTTWARPDGCRLKRRKTSFLSRSC